jgi:hypothetical protein
MCHNSRISARWQTGITEIDWFRRQPGAKAVWMWSIAESPTEISIVACLPRTLFGLSLRFIALNIGTTRHPKSEEFPLRQTVMDRRQYFRVEEGLDAMRSLQ